MRENKKIKFNYQTNLNTKTLTNHSLKRELEWFHEKLIHSHLPIRSISYSTFLHWKDIYNKCFKRHKNEMVKVAPRKHGLLHSQTWCSTTER